jgi:hypothetical protein
MGDDEVAMFVDAVHPTHAARPVGCWEFAEATLVFLRDEVPRRWAELCDSVTDNFRVISPKDFRLLG